MKVMPRPRPPHLHREITRHGKAVWYVRIGKGRRVAAKRKPIGRGSAPGPPMGIASRSVMSGYRTSDTGYQFPAQLVRCWM